MNETQIAALAKAVAPVFRRYVDETVAPLLRKIDELEARQPENGEKGDPGADGRNGNDGSAGERGEKGEPGKDGIGVVDGLINADGELILTFSDGKTKSVGRVVGRDGSPGKDAGIETIKAIVSELADAKTFDPDAVKSLIPAPVRGEKGEVGDRGESAYHIAVRNGFQGSEGEWLKSLRGEPGKDGQDGESVSVDVIRSLIESEVKKVPAPKDGRDGKDGRDADEATIIARAEQLITQKFSEIPKPKDGVDGKDGRGESAYEVARKNGFSGSESEWLKSLRGKDGTRLIFGDGPPASSNALGDVYVDRKTWDVYQNA